MSAGERYPVREAPRYPEPLPPPGEDDHLAYEQEQDRLAEEEIDAPEDDHGPPPAPPGLRLPRATLVLGVLLVGLLFFLAGIYAQKLLGGSGAPPAAAPAARAPDDGLTGGRVIAVRDRTVYVREASGRTVRLRLRPDSRVAVGGAAGAAALRPGQDVLAASAPGSGGDADARVIVVVPERQRAP